MLAFLNQGILETNKAPPPTNPSWRKLGRSTCGHVSGDFAHWHKHGRMRDHTKISGPNGLDRQEDILSLMSRGLRRGAYLRLSNRVGERALLCTHPSLALPHPQLTPAYWAHLLERREVGECQGELRADPLVFIRSYVAVATPLPIGNTPLGRPIRYPEGLRWSGPKWRSRAATPPKLILPTARLVLLGRNSIKERTTVFIFVRYLTHPEGFLNRSSLRSSCMID
jgi:hypothetical protein